MKKIPKDLILIFDKHLIEYSVEIGVKGFDVKAYSGLLKTPQGSTNASML